MLIRNSHVLQFTGPRNGDGAAGCIQSPGPVHLQSQKGQMGISGMVLIAHLLASTITDCCLHQHLQAVSWSAATSHLSLLLPRRPYQQHQHHSQPPVLAQLSCQTADHPRHAVAPPRLSALSCSPISTTPHHDPLLLSASLYVSNRGAY